VGPQTAPLEQRVRPFIERKHHPASVELRRCSGVYDLGGSSSYEMGSGY